MPAGLKTPFQPGHELKFGLEITERDPETLLAVSVVCRFCLKFGREEKSNGKRRRTAKTQLFKFPFRVDSYKRHHENVHSTAWQQYQEATETEKMAFFDAASPPSTSEQNHAVSTGNPVKTRLAASRMVTETPQRAIAPNSTLARDVNEAARANLNTRVADGAPRRQPRETSTEQQRLEFDIMMKSEEGLSEDAITYLCIRRRQILRRLQEEMDDE